MITLVKKLWNDESGQGLVEYALIIALVGVALVLALGTLREGIEGVFTSASDKLGAAGQ